MTEDEIIAYFWIIGEIIVILAIIIDYSLYSDERSRYDQENINTWYGLFFMGWPVGLVLLLVLCFATACSWICMRLLDGCKFLIQKALKHLEESNSGKEDSEE